MKDNDEVVGLTEYSATLQRSDGRLTRDGMSCQEYEYEASISHAQTTVDIQHNKERPGVQKVFLQDIKALKASFDEYGNPFLKSSDDLLVIDTMNVVDKAIMTHCTKEQ